jgi:hypothetical protein
MATIQALSDENTTIRADLTLFLRLAIDALNSRLLAIGRSTAMFTSTGSHQHDTSEYAAVACVCEEGGSASIKSGLSVALVRAL